jgi:outer membrane protein assembly factor BamB
MNGVTYVSGCDENFRAIRVSDGEEAYMVDSGAYIGASPALADGFAYFGTYDNRVLAVDMKAKKIAWSYEHPQRKFPYYSSAALVGGKVILGGRDKMLHCLDARTGKELWSFMTKARIESSPAVADTRVFFGSNDGRFYVVDVNTGKQLWEFEAGAPLSASPAVAGGRIVIGSQDGKLYCFGE